MAQQVGAIRGVVRDREFDGPVPSVKILVVGTELVTTSTDQGNFAIQQVPPGSYRLLFTKEGFLSLEKASVVVTAGQLTNVDVVLTGDFTDLEDFVVHDLLRLGTGSE
jgi:hypothetical protein